MADKEYEGRPEDQTTSQRFEAKYIIREFQAQMILDYMAPYVTTDSHVKWGEPYVINSLYLDSPQLELFWSSRLGEKNRKKLRIRSYTDHPEDPVFFEIKRRVNQVILKQRAIIKREYVPAILRGEEIPLDAFLKPTPKERNNFYAFRDIMESMNAGPIMMVRYTREAYMSNLEEPVRITFDRELAGLACREYHHGVWTYGPHWSEIEVAPVIMELKFTNTFPSWVRRIIQRFHLPQTSFAKYVTVVEVIKQEGGLASWLTHSEDPLWVSEPPRWSSLL